MSIHQCIICGGFYAEPKEVKDFIMTCVEKDKPLEVSIFCPHCQRSRIVVGGEPDFDFISNTNCVLSFTRDSWSDDKKLPHYEGVLLESCSKDSSEFSTISLYSGNEVYLKQVIQ